MFRNRAAGPPRERRRAVGLVGALLGVMVALLPASSATARTPQAASDASAAPRVLPAPRTWDAAPGEFRLGRHARIVLADADARTRADARRFARELRETTGRAPAVVAAHGDGRPGDIVLRQDTSRKRELGTEGYRLESGDRLTVTGATSTGVFYGTRTALQLLREDRTAPAGTTTDVPEYRERGVGVCACYTHVSMEWFERLMRDMAYQKLNQLWIEAKVKSDVDPESAFWGYYTKDEIRSLRALAERYHIELVPEINSPGHMDPYLENHPELQLKDKNGKASPPRLDITRPEAFAYYTSLVDEALEVWDTPTWHMGADEYMIGSAYPNYPQLQAYATEKFGAGATPDDVFVDFINQVNAHVRADGRTLRMWNDGLSGRNTVVPLDRNIAVEHWLGGGETQKPSSLLAEGRPVMNSAYSLYLVRGGYTMNTRHLYESGWTPLRFEGETLVSRPENLTGAKISLWPDSAAAETENEVEAKAFMPLRFIAQATWGGPRPSATYAGFEELARGIGHAPGWANTDRTPLADGTYALVRDGERLAPTAREAGATVGLTSADDATWAVAATSDGYYSLRSAQTGLCLDANRGKRYLGAPLESGAELSQETCSAEKRTQRWQVTGRRGSVTLVNAVSQLGLTTRATDGTALQTAPDVTAPTRLRAVPQG
ncbi:family 20 glycosylhydrolase [Streptomyces sp. AC512_CC834]|uniref:family 20 glycosylhydrolase n=1 Tax=Streptomyces sp. AC512_CC834 TaxID=2823691 RepID=UPI0020B8C182|nr:family 20 glycosylhydrolase [Streptomyces sp. AC512_CC834]